MSPEKKRSSKKHFLETESGFSRLLKENAKDIPSEETLIAIHDYNIRKGTVNLSKLASGIPGTAGYHLSFIMSAEQKSDHDASKELGVSVRDVRVLQGSLEPVKDKTLFEFCTEFVKEHPQFSLRPLFTILKRAIVLHSMSSGEAVIRKAARKKPQK